MDPIEELCNWMMQLEDDDEQRLDRFDVLEKVAPVMEWNRRVDLCGMLDVCPIHMVDIEICADDDVQECKTHWK